MIGMEEAVRLVSAPMWGGAPGLARIRALTARLGDPQARLRFVHVAGTNGKGSTAAMLAAILTAAGYRTGLFTSPHLSRWNERFRIDGREILDADFCAAAEAMGRCLEDGEESPTEFERLTAMALWYFARERCDVVVWEVGLGGRFDATNVIGVPEAAVITNLDLEHTAVLGDTIEQIAFEKAGIIKPGGEVVLYRQSAAATDVIRQACAERRCPLTITDGAQQRLLAHDLSGQTFSYRGREGLRLGLIGAYQYKNAAVVLDTVDALRRGGWRISEDAIRAGLARAVWPARFEVLRRAPLVLLDGAHNPNGARELARCFASYLPGRKLTLVMGVMADKDSAAMLDAVAPYARDFVAVTASDSPRAMPSAALAERIRAQLGLPARDGGSVCKGVALALAAQQPDEAVCIFGSLYLAGEARQYLLSRFGA